MSLTFWRERRSARHGAAPDLVGPETQDLVDMARRTLDARQDGTRLHATWCDGPFKTEMSGEVLLPRGVRISSTTFDNGWNRRRSTGDADAGGHLSLLDPDLAPSRAHTYHGCRSPSRSNRHGRRSKDLDGQGSLPQTLGVTRPLGSTPPVKRITDPSSSTHGSQFGPYHRPPSGVLAQLARELPGKPPDSP